MSRGPPEPADGGRALSSPGLRGSNRRNARPTCSDWIVRGKSVEKSSSSAGTSRLDSSACVGATLPSSPPELSASGHVSSRRSCAPSISSWLTPRRVSVPKTPSPTAEWTTRWVEGSRSTRVSAAMRASSASLGSLLCQNSRESAGVSGERSPWRTIRARETRRVPGGSGGPGSTGCGGGSAGIEPTPTPRRRRPSAALLRRAENAMLLVKVILGAKKCSGSSGAKSG